jgi:hypothetical protein
MSATTKKAVVSNKKLVYDIKAPYLQSRKALLAALAKYKLSATIIFGSSRTRIYAFPTVDVLMKILG